MWEYVLYKGNENTDRLVEDHVTKVKYGKIVAALN
jgi:hypothetical protein